MTVTDFSSFSNAPLTGTREHTVRLVRTGRRDSEARAPGVRIPQLGPRVLQALVAAGLLGSIAILGAVWIDTASGSWYSALSKPKYTESAPTLLGVGWTAVCASAAVAVWLVAQRRERGREVVGAMVAFLSQLVLLLAWVWTFFVGHQIGRSLLVTLVLIIASAVSVVGFGRISRAAGALMVPALLWSVAVAGLAGGLAVLS
jgi:tryptophan-rich sensory protein